MYKEVQKEKFISYYLSGEMVHIITLHKWFGKEKYRYQFELIYDDIKIGFRIQNKEIYILKAELESIEKQNRVYYISDSLMKISIIP